MSTLQDIAAETGLTAMTVSRILNGRNKENRPSMVARAAAVRAVAERLGYRPYAAARHMRQGRTGLVALVRNPAAGGAYLTGLLLHHLGLALGRIERDLLLTELDEGGELPALVRERRVDGLLIDDISSVPAAMSEAIARWRIPAVWLNAKLAQAAVHPDDLGGGRMAAACLAERGCRRIAFLSLSGDSHYSVADRLAGARAELGEGLVATCLAHPPAGRAAVQVARELLTARPRPDAVIAYGEREAAAVLAAAAELGLAVPQALQLVAFAPVAIDRLGHRVTTVRIPMGRVGLEAVEVLAAAMAAKRRSIATRAVPYRDLDLGETTG